MNRVSSPFLDSGRQVVIVDAVRTPIGRAHRDKGAYRDTHPNALLGACYKELIDRSGLNAEEIEDVIAGCTAPFGEQSRNIARNAWLQAGYPVEVPAMPVSSRSMRDRKPLGLWGSGSHLSE